MKLQGHLWRGHPKVGKYTGSDVSQERKKRDLARKVQAPKREIQKTRNPENQKTRTLFAVFVFSCLHVQLAFSFFRFFGFSCFRVSVLSCVQCWRFRFFAFSCFRVFVLSRVQCWRFRVLPAAPPRPDTHFVCTGCFRVPNIYAKGRFEFLLFFWLPSFAVLGASFKECFFACFFSLGGGSQAKRKIKPSNRKPCLINYLSSSW